MDRLSHSAIIDRRQPGSVYSTTIMRRNDGVEKVLMVSQDKSNVVTLQSVLVNDEYETSVAPLNFPNIPGDAEVLAVHCINPSEEFDRFAVGLSYATDTEEDDDSNEIYLNIYSGSPGSSLDVVLKNCKTLKLDFLPFQLNHGICACDTRKEGIWLLSGSDKKIHAYKSNELQIDEQKIEEYFVEFLDTKDSVVLCFDTKAFCNYKKRVSFYGGETGKSMLAVVDSEKNQILHTVLERYRSPITSVQLFNIYNKTMNLEEILSDPDLSFMRDDHSIDEEQQVCMLVGSVECAIVYMNVLEKHLKEPVTLIEIGRGQAVTTSLITDINFDSKNEILLGTHENRILSYEYNDKSWVELQSIDLRYPVYTISYIDLTGEGVKDAIVMTKKGIHILKHEPKDIIEILMQRITTD